MLHLEARAGQRRRAHRAARALQPVRFAREALGVAAQRAGAHALEPKARIARKSVEQLEHEAAARVGADPGQVAQYRDIDYLHGSSRWNAAPGDARLATSRVAPWRSRIARHADSPMLLAENTSLPSSSTSSTAVSPRTPPWMRTRLPPGERSSALAITWPSACSRRSGSARTSMSRSTSHSMRTPRSAAAALRHSTWAWT